MNLTEQKFKIKLPDIELSLLVPSDIAKKDNKDANKLYKALCDRMATSFFIDALYKLINAERDAAIRDLKNNEL